MSTMTGRGYLPFKLEINEDVCRHCGRCLAAEVCRGNAFRMFDPEEGAFIDMSRCWGCLSCIVTCPFGAVVKVEYGG
ncbi:MAG TPA: 4Fe-4S dicluster domain-containing protein [Chloroflexi bacterium]|nr:4Fe-4S dicluster domain-containing protein [Chloroflexota bacterium]